MQKRTSDKTKAGKSGFFYSILPQSRAGKSVLVASILTQAYFQETPAVIRGYLKLDATSTFSDYTEFIDKQGAYFDITKQQHNLLLPELQTVLNEN